jgi:hypothetical protein
MLITFHEAPRPESLPRAGMPSKYVQLWRALSSAPSEWLRINVEDAGGLDVKRKIGNLMGSAFRQLGRRIQVVTEGSYLFIRFRPKEDTNTPAVAPKSVAAVQKAKPAPKSISATPAAIPSLISAPQPEPPQPRAAISEPPVTLTPTQLPAIAPARPGPSLATPQTNPLVVMSAAIEAALTTLASEEPGEVVMLDLGNNPNLYPHFKRELLASAAAKKMVVELDRDATELIIQLVKFK